MALLAGSYWPDRCDDTTRFSPEQQKETDLTALHLGPKLLELIFDPRSLQIAELSRAFNPFRVLRVEKYELRHTNTLAWLLTPSGSHGLGNAFATQFLKAVCAQAEAKLGNGIAALTVIAQTDLDAIHVRQEVTVDQLKSLDKSEAEAAIDGTLGQVVEPSVDEDDQPGRLDVLIEGETWAVAVEAKVNGKQGDGQLSKYQRGLNAGAPGRQKVFVYLTNDLSEDVPTDWNAVSWKAAVAEPLRQIVARVPDARKSEAQIVFLESFLEILAENCTPAEGPRETLLASLVADYGSLLNEFRIRRKSAALTESDLELVRRNSELINLLGERYQPANQQRYPMLKKVVESDSRFHLVASSRMYIKFVLAEWLNVPWMKVPGKDANDAAVLCELVNHKNGGIQLKLQIRYLGVSDDFQAKRLRLLTLIQQDARTETRTCFFKVFTQAGFREPDEFYFTVYSSRQLPSPAADSESGVFGLLNGQFISSVNMMTKFIAMV
ncbi:hypothetical protein J2W28_004458 [Variovorax boronicumulans]|uniref:PDDEXK-like family protein n=1 Tax=Variovorax boronicumulans TaxID=436515 RepID=UPI0027865AF3|nr:PD-(D/E)XK nuclease family protein [Variovorax boronicumulans]MDP9993840.1 hypothetical protein [Variovorax boronicumulans]MDQ0005296.1 hypothetical protein [Variovorax boronicumulans]